MHLATAVPHHSSPLVGERVVVAADAANIHPQKQAIAPLCHSCESERRGEMRGNASERWRYGNESGTNGPEHVLQASFLPEYLLKRGVFPLFASCITAALPKSSNGAPKSFCRKISTFACCIPDVASAARFSGAPTKEPEGRSAEIFLRAPSTSCSSATAWLDLLPLLVDILSYQKRSTRGTFEEE